jgi:hypothetical protein
MINISFTWICRYCVFNQRTDCFIINRYLNKICFIYKNNKDEFYIIPVTHLFVLDLEYLENNKFEFLPILTSQILTGFSRFWLFLKKLKRG